jgi:hypothetical protein
VGSLESAAAGNGKKGIRLCQEDVMCDVKIQCDCDKPVAKIRLMKIENPSAFAK